MREKWKKHRGWTKVHIAVDVKTNEIVAIETTDKRISDHEVFGDLIDQAEDNVGEGGIERVVADGAYDTRGCFNILEEKGIACEV